MIRSSNVAAAAEIAWSPATRLLSPAGLKRNEPRFDPTDRPWTTVAETRGVGPSAQTGRVQFRTRLESLTKPIPAEIPKATYMKQCLFLRRGDWMFLFCFGKVGICMHLSVRLYH